MTPTQTRQEEVIMDFVEDNRYYAVMMEPGRGLFMCRCNDPLLIDCIDIPPKVVIALRELLKIDRDYALETLRTILHK